MSEAPVIPAPDAADRKPRAAKPPVTDPEAPYGWIKDPKAPGGKRPKLRPGKQAKSETPPRQRPATKTRSAATVGQGSTEKHAKAVTGLTEGVWVLLAAIPPADLSVPGTKINVKDVSSRSRAQAEILETNQAGLVQGLVMIADHSAPVSKALLKLDSKDSPIWVMPAMMALLPFVVQSMAMYSAPINGEVQAMAERTGEKFAAILGNVVKDDGSQQNGDGAGGTTVPGPAAYADQAV